MRTNGSDGVSGRTHGKDGRSGKAIFAACAFVLAVVGGLLVVRFCQESPRKLLWLDELYTFYQVKVMSAGRFFESLGSGANLMPPLYFFVLWTVGQVVELTPLVLRSVSLLALLVCVPVLVRSLGRVVMLPVAMLAVAAGLLSDRMVWDQVVEARPYALGILFVALLASVLIRSAGQTQVSWVSWCWLAALNFCLPATHYFLGLYSAIALGVVVLADVSLRRWRWRLYLAFAGGWGGFVVFCGPLLRRQLANVGAGTGWIPISTRADLWAYVGQIGVVLGWVIVAVGCAAVLLRQIRGPGSLAGAEVAQPSGYVHEKVGVWRVSVGLALGWTLFPLTILALSGLTRRGFFVDRYFAPSIVGFVLAAALLGECVWSWCASKRGRPTRELGENRSRECVLGAVACVGVLLLAGVRYVRPIGTWQPGHERLADEVNRLAEPKVSEDEHAYFHALYYGPQGGSYFLICDDEAVRARWRTFSPAVQTISMEELARLPHFLWLSPEVKRSAESLTAWAAGAAYEVSQRVATEPDGVHKIGWRTYYEFTRR